MNCALSQKGRHYFLSQRNCNVLEMVGGKYQKICWEVDFWHQDKQRMSLYHCWLRLVSKKEHNMSTVHVPCVASLHSPTHHISLVQGYFCLGCVLRITCSISALHPWGILKREEARQFLDVFLQCSAGPRTYQMCNLPIPEVLLQFEESQSLQNTKFWVSCQSA